MDIVDGFSYQTDPSWRPPHVETGTVTVATDVNDIAQVNCAGNSEKVRVPKNVFISVGDVVLILRGSGKAWVIHKLSDSAQLPYIGTVGTVSGGTTIPVNYTKYSKTYTINLPFLGSYSPTNGDTVQIIWRPDGTGGYVAGKLGTVAPPPPPPPPPPDDHVPPAPAPGSGNSGYNTFAAQDSASFRNGKWRTDTRNVVQHDWGGYGNNNGAWFYGSSPRDYLAGATCTKLKIKVQRRSGGVWGPQNIHFHFHTSDTRPGGNVSYTAGPADTAVDIGETREIELPTAWGQTLINTGGGIGIQNSPYVVLAGIDTMSDSGLITIDWTR